MVGMTLKLYQSYACCSGSIGTRLNSRHINLNHKPRSNKRACSTGIRTEPHPGGRGQQNRWQQSRQTGRQKTKVVKALSRTPPRKRDGQDYCRRGEASEPGCCTTAVSLSNDQTGKCRCEETSRSLSSFKNVGCRQSYRYRITRLSYWC